MLPNKDSPCAPSLPRATVVTNITAFIESVRPHAYLYDKSQPEFKDSTLKVGRWALIANEHGITAVQAQKKWRNLKDKYVRLKKKMYLDNLTAGQSGLANGAAPKAKWVFYDLMDAILSTIYDTITITPVPSVQQTVETPFNAIAEGMLDSMIKWQEHHLADMAIPPTPQQPLSATCGTSSGTRKRKPSETVRSMAAATASTSSEAMAEKRPREADEMHHYCLYLASRLRRLSNRGRIQAINDIQAAMFEIEMKETGS